MEKAHWAHSQCERDVPELELGHTPDEGAELVIVVRGEGGLILGVDLRREEAYEEVQEVDGERVGDDVPPGEVVHPQDVEEGDGGSEAPSGEWVGRPVIEQLLEFPPQGHPQLGHEGWFM